MADLVIVEDETAFRHFVSLALEMEGYTTRTFEDGLEAIESMQQQPTDLLILDLSMPHFSGWDVIDTLQIDPMLKDTPVVVITANADEHTKRRARSEKMIDGLLIKPVGIEEILAAVNKAISP